MRTSRGSSANEFVLLAADPDITVVIRSSHHIAYIVTDATDMH